MTIIPGLLIQLLCVIISTRR